MYEPLLFVHSWTRWIVFLSMLFFFLRALIGGWKGSRWTGRENHFLWIFNQLFGFQIAFGLTLWLGFSPFNRAVLRDPSLFATSAVIRFWTVRHGLTMLVAFSVWHLGRAKLKRAKPERRFRICARTFGIVLALVASAIPWPWLEYGRPLLRWFR